MKSPQTIQLNKKIDRLNYLEKAMPKVKGVGSSIRLQNTIEYPFYKFKLLGNAFQKSYIGKNLFNIAQVNNLALATTIVSATNYRGYTLPVNPGETYTISRKAIDSTDCFRVAFTKVIPASGVSFYNQSKAEHSYEEYGSSTNGTVTIPTEMNYLFIYLSNSNLTITETMQIQIELGSSVTSYEPYTNGPSPNPNYPQDIQVVTGDNNILVQNKNICNRANKSNVNTMYVRYENGGLGNIVTLSFKTDVSVTDVSVYPDGLSELSQTINIIANTRVSVTFNLTDEQIKTAMSVASPRFIINKSNANWTEINEVQIENNSVATEYIAHQEQKYLISLGSIELCKIGDCQDYIYKSGDNWYIHKEIAKKILNGTENWRAQNVTNFQFSLSDKQYPNKEMYCNKFICYTSWQSITKPYFRSASNLSLWAELGRNNTLIDEATAEKWKNWLSNNNTILYHVSATATDTQITDTTLIAQLNNIYENVKSYSIETNVESTYETSNVPFYLDVEAIENIETRIIALEESIISQE